MTKPDFFRFVTWCFAVVAVTAMFFTARESSEAAEQDASKANKAEKTKWNQAQSLCESRGIKDGKEVRLASEAIFATCRLTNGPEVGEVITIEQREACAAHFLDVMQRIADKAVSKEQQDALVQFIQLDRRAKVDRKLQEDLQSLKASSVNPANSEGK